MVKKGIEFLVVLFFLGACGDSSNENQHYYFSATSAHWKANMSVLLPPPPDHNFELEITFVYTGKEKESGQVVTYNHILEWHDLKHASISSESDFLPDAENPKQVTLYDTHFLGAYEIGQRWITEVVWYEEGEERKEELIFEQVD
ncbi:hypothetical protein JCM9140_3947 [Halalkalibacter wakoensis JCM 9140]|uniref:Lipoprotein n=1 Tax=Halalkalibacter wakoensis JCM 9140 TaxID=1236970 RepID=W4Q7V8_9BACI|nr:hypothetical protein [Halalkalibacter wakoensis]GAE27788.1 hypothetical protein JCM9140_3947 [Halalkalibacter wakoensis JCM 9140]